MRHAGLPMQTGTVPVERLWSTAQCILPSQARNMRLPWFRFLADMAYLRINFQHFNGPSLPGWCRNDAVLKESFNSLLSCALSFSQAAGGERAGPLQMWFVEMLRAVSM